jgi:Lysylphosphatidylglycerol synthase TM region
LKLSARWLWLLALAVLLGLIFASSGLGTLFAEALGRVTVLSVLATLPGQIAATLLCGAALHALRPGVSFRASLASRMLRDAGDNLLVFLPGLGEVIGARSLVLAGGRTRAAISASALDKFAETLAQVPYIALAAWVLWRGWQSTFVIALSDGEIAVIAILVIALILAARYLFRSNRGVRLREEWHKLTAEAREQKSGLPLSTALHFLAWVMGGLQMWMAAHALGADISLFEAIAIESAAYAGRAILFFVPAGLVTQEAGLLAAGLVFGMSAPQALALGLVLRLRDAVFGLPLLVWPLFEWRKARGER